MHTIVIYHIDMQCIRKEFEKQQECGFYRWKSNTRSKKKIDIRYDANAEIFVIILFIE